MFVVSVQVFWGQTIPQCIHFSWERPKTTKSIDLENRISIVPKGILFGTTRNKRDFKSKASTKIDNNGERTSKFYCKLFNIILILRIKGW